MLSKVCPSYILLITKVITKGLEGRIRETLERPAVVSYTIGADITMIKSAGER
jgi:hypothetical protein